MKKLKIQLLLIAALLISGVVTANAQGFQGIATYQTVKDLGSMAIQTEGMAPAMKKQIADMMKKRSQKEFILNFNSNEANWREVASQDNGLKYRHIAKNVYMEEVSLFDLSLLVIDELTPIEWVLTDETKQIGEYTAQKATFIRTWKRVSQISSTNDTEIVTDTAEVEAWYTSQIPVSQGPDSYWGLPGLILELNDGKMTYQCTEVIINPEEVVEISKPSKGRKVNLEEYKKIREEKRDQVARSLSGGK